MPLVEANLQTIGSERNWTTSWEERQQQYQSFGLRERTRTVRVSLQGVPSKTGCSWKRIAGPGEPEEPVRQSCDPQKFVVPLDTVTEVKIEVTPKGGVPKPLPIVKVQPRDVLIAMLGDSYGSGEGNPHLTTLVPRQNAQTQYPAIWWDTRCHRSLLSSAAQAAGFLAYSNKKQSVTFISYACSGAEIQEGILKEFAGRQTVPQTKAMWQGMEQPTDDLDAVAGRGDRDKLKPQIDALNEALCIAGGSCSTKLRPDILLIAVGGNDIAFGEIGRDLLLKNPPPGEDARDAWREQKKGQLKPIFEELDKRFVLLAQAVREKIHPKRVYLYEYVDPSQYSIAKNQDRFCGRESDQENLGRYGRFSSGLKTTSYRGAPAPGSTEQRREAAARNYSLYNILLTQDEGEFANWTVQNLNDSIRYAGKNLAWTNEPFSAAKVLKLQNLKGPDDLRRGICARNSWFLGLIESWQRQDWIPEDKINAYPLILATAANCSGEMRDDGKCWVPAGPVTSGVLHPNFFGHYNVGKVVLDELKKDLATPPSP